MATANSKPPELIFPIKLHRLLSAAEPEGFDDVISWYPDGKSFKVHDKKRFECEVMPRFLGPTKYRSFQKCLNMWGFNAIRGGPDKGKCSHSLFLRDEKFLCQRIFRRQIIQKPRAQAARSSIVSARSLATSSNRTDNDVRQGIPTSLVRTVHPSKTLSSQAVSSPNRGNVDIAAPRPSWGQSNEGPDEAESCTSSFINESSDDVTDAVMAVTRPPRSKPLALTSSSVYEELVDLQENVRFDRATFLRKSLPSTMAGTTRVPPTCFTQRSHTWAEGRQDRNGTDGDTWASVCPTLDGTSSSLYQAFQQRRLCQQLLAAGSLTNYGITKAGGNSLVEHPFF